MSSLLNDYLGSFIEGLDPSQLRLNVWSGKVHLKSLSIKPTALDGLHLPVRVLSGRVSSLRLEANWRALTSQPVKVELEGVDLLLGPRTAPASPSTDGDEEEKSFQSKLRSLSAVEEFRLHAEAEAASTESSTTSYMKRLTATVINNVQISIKEIHLRYVSEEGGQRRVIGVGLEELSAFTTNEQWKREFTTGGQLGYRLVQLNNLFVYCNERGEQAQGEEEEEEGGEEEKEGGGGLSLPRLLDVLDSPSTRFVLSPLSGSLQMVQRMDEGAGGGSDGALPRFSLSCDFPSIELSLGQRQYRHVLKELSSLSAAHRLLQSSAAALPSPAASNDRPLSREERKRYVELYKRTLNAMWTEELSGEERAEMQSMERTASVSSLAQARTFGWFELKKELQGRSVKTRQAGKDEAAKNKGGGGILKGFFGRKSSQLPHEELTDQQKEDLYALLEQEEGEEEGEVGSDGPSHTPDRVEVEMQVNLKAVTASLLDAEYRPMVRLAAEGGTAHVVKRQKGFTAELGMQSLRCTEEILPLSQYSQLMTALPLDTTPPTTGTASSSTPPPFFHAVYEDHPEGVDCDRRLSLQVSSPIIQVHQPLLSALLTFFAVPPTLDLATFSAWSLQQLDALRSFSTTSLADALSTHSALDLNIDLTAPTIVIPLDPMQRYTPLRGAGGVGSDVVVLNLGHLRLTTELRGKAEVANTLDRVRKAAGDHQLDEEMKGRLYDLYHVTITRTSLFLSAMGPEWSHDPSPSFLLDPLDLRLDVQSAVSKEVNWLPNFRLQGALELLRLRVSERKVRRMTKFLEAFQDIDSIPPFVKATLLPKEQWKDPQPDVKTANPSPSKALQVSEPSRASTVSPTSTAVVLPFPSSSSSSSSPPPPPSSSLDLNDLVDLFHGDRVKARAVLMELDHDGNGEVESGEVVAWERRRLLSRTHKQLLQLHFQVTATALSIEREEGGTGEGEEGKWKGKGAEVLLTAQLEGLSVTLLRETFVTRIAVTLQRVSARDTSALSEKGEGRLLLDTNPAASPIGPLHKANQSGSDLEEEEGQKEEDRERSDPPPSPSPSPSSSSPSSVGFLNVSLVQMSVDSPEFSRRRVEGRVEATVGELRVFVDVTSAYRLGSFFLFELLPAATRTTSRKPPTMKATSITTTTPLSPSSFNFPLPSSPSSSSSSSSSSAPLPRSHQTRLSVRATFEGLLVSTCVGGEAVSEGGHRRAECRLGGVPSQCGRVRSPAVPHCEGLHSPRATSLGNRPLLSWRLHLLLPFLRFVEVDGSLLSLSSHFPVLSNVLPCGRRSSSPLGRLHCPSTRASLCLLEALHR